MVDIKIVDQSNPKSLVAEVEVRGVKYLLLIPKSLDPLDRGSFIKDFTESLAGKTDQDQFGDSRTHYTNPSSGVVELILNSTGSRPLNGSLDIGSVNNNLEPRDAGSLNTVELNLSDNALINANTINFSGRLSDTFLISTSDVTDSSLASSYQSPVSELKGLEQGNNNTGALFSQTTNTAFAETTTAKAATDFKLPDYKNGLATYPTQGASLSTIDIHTPTQEIISKI